MTCFRATLVSALLLPAAAWAEAPSTEPALAIAWQDSSVKWNPCPPFMPQGCGLAVLHGDPAKPNADVLLKVPGGSTIAEHWHSSAERMILVSGELEVTYEGQKPAVLKKGSYAYGPAKKPHVATCAKGDPCVLFIAFEGPVDALPGKGH